MGTLNVKKDGAAWKILSGEDLEETLSGWEKGITDMHDEMRKVEDALSAEKNKSQQKPKSRRAVRRK